MVVGGTPAPVEWVACGSAAACSDVTIELYSGDMLTVRVVSATPNAQRSFDWTPPDDLAFGSDYRMRVACSDSSFEDFSQYFSVDCTPRPTAPPTPVPSPLPSLTPTASPPHVRIIEPLRPASSKVVLVEPSQRIQFSASVDFGEPTFDVQWWSPDCSVNDTAMFSTPPDSLYLVVKAGQLLAGHRYFFEITGVDSLGRSDKANITVVGNYPPVNGSLWTSPRKGLALATHFELISLGWQDPEHNFPLSYRFAYISGSGDGASVMIGGGKSVEYLNSTMFPYGTNLTLQVAVTDTMGATTNAFDSVLVTEANNIASRIRNTTALIDALISSGDSIAATALIASCSDMLNIASESISEEDNAAAASVRANLLSLLIGANSSSGAEEPSLRAATLELIVGVPSQLDHATQASAVAYTSDILAGISTISEETRSSLMGALSSVVQAGFLKLDSRRRRLANGGSAAYKITTALQSVHLLTLQELAPREEPVSTQSRALSLSTSKASCWLGTCVPTRVHAPALLTVDATSAESSEASFELGEATLKEIVGKAVTCAVDGSAELGMMAVSWETNPHGASEEGSQVENRDITFPRVGNVTSLSVTACGGLVAVENLTSPITVSLPVSSRSEQAASANTSDEVIEGTCKANGKYLVTCSTNVTVNLTCPGVGFRWNVTCPPIVAAPACRFFDDVGGRWGMTGCEVVNASSANNDLTCRCTHLTDFTAMIGLRFGKAKTIVTRTPTQEDLVRSLAVLCILIAIFCTASFVFTRDRRYMAAQRENRITEIWDSVQFQRSLAYLHSFMSEGGQETVLPLSVPAQSAQERDIERAQVLETQRRNAVKQLQALVAPTWQTSFMDYRQRLNYEHPIFILLTPNHATLERSPIVLLRTISLLRECSLTCCMSTEA